jgi:hypothetical protein
MSQNFAKIIYNGTHILHNDPCHRFAFGITIENDSMTLWAFGRSGVMMSTPFNWIMVCIVQIAMIVYLCSYVLIITGS